MSDFKTVKAVHTYVSKLTDKFIMLSCTSTYPTPTEDINLNVIKTYQKEFPNTIIIKELVYYNTRGFTHALALLPSIILMSDCKHIITTSNNVSFWTILYRGNADNVYQSYL